MFSVNQINSSGSFQKPGRSGTLAPGFADQIAIINTDILLQTTRQHAKWQTIMRNDPARSADIARLVIKRHGYLSGEKPTNQAGRLDFDRLTVQLSKLGIHLYRSDQFANPIFEISRPPGPVEDIKSASYSDTAVTSGHAKLDKLRKRFSNKDCLEFLAGVLEDKGISYYGKNGIANALLDRARNEDKKLNTYLTGEGITHLLCRQPVSIHVPRESDNSFEQIWHKLLPHIRKGAILSFSSRYAGHTGIIDRSNGQWSFVNSSGTAGRPQSYKVLSEDLKDEIQNWWQRSRRQDTFLNITVGTIDTNRAEPYFRRPFLAGNLPQREFDLLI